MATYFLLIHISMLNYYKWKYSLFQIGSNTFIYKSLIAISWWNVNK